MDSDDFSHEFPSFDASALAEIDAIESACLGRAGPSNPPKPTTSAPNRPSAPAPLESDDSFAEFDDFVLDAEELARIDMHVNDVYAGTAKPILKPLARSGSMKQLTLYGTAAVEKAPKPRSQAQSSSKVTTAYVPVEQWPKKDLVWGQVECAASGSSKAKAEEVISSPRQPPPMKLEADLLSARHYIYPIDPRYEKREYQFNIVRRALFENTLVCLPTGLGKTFVAGAVMLNYYRWFPQGKIIFLAPTKPLVSQQVRACIACSGINAEDAVEMNGEIPSRHRERYWEDKRVFFMTPQTALNDLRKGVCDPMNVILIVVDEAHRSGGGYAYSETIQLMMKRNPHFRVLALSATPSNKVENVQHVINTFHISHIEIRDYTSLDLRKYVYEKKIETHIIAPNEHLERAQTALATLLEEMMKPHRYQGGFSPRENGLNVHPFRAMSLARETQASGQQWRYKPLYMISQLARGMMYLMSGSFEASYQYLLGVMDGDSPDAENSPVKKKKPTPVPKLKPVIEEFAKIKAENDGFPMHPKVEKLKELLIQYFGSKMPDAEEGGDGSAADSRVMIFSSYRSVVGEIVTELNKEQPLIRAAQFVGQGVDKYGGKGLKQKSQIELIEKFQEGEFNVLVATSIGEEGLDIGEIDMIVSYDSDSSVTRMLQRFGRTGRKRAGVVHVLLAQDREENNLKKAQGGHDLIIDQLTKGIGLHLYGDVPRLVPLLPGGKKPECKEIEMAPQKYVPPKPPSPKRGGGAKRKRNDDINRNIPAGVTTGFTSVMEMMQAGKKSKKSKPNRDFEEAGKDDEDDEAIESGSIRSPATSRADPEKAKAKKGKQPASRKSTTTKSKGKGKEKALASRSSNFADWGEDDELDKAIESGTIAGPSLDLKPPPRPRPVPRGKKKQPTPSPSPPPAAQTRVIDLSDSEGKGDSDSPPQPKRRKMSPPSRQMSLSLSPPGRKAPKPAPRLRKQTRSPSPLPKDNSVLVLSDSELEFFPPSQKHAISDHRSPSPVRRLEADGPPDNDLSWLAKGDSDDEPMFDLAASPIPRSKAYPVMERIQIDDESFEISKPVPSTSRAGQRAPGNQPKSRIKKRSPSPTSESHVSDSEEESRRPITIPKPKSNPLFLPSDDDVQAGPSQLAMPPPPVPFRRNQSEGLDPESPGFSQPIRRLGVGRRLVKVPLASPLRDDSETMPPPSHSRFQRLASTPSKSTASSSKAKAKPKERSKAKERRPKPSLLDRRSAFLFDGEAEHSGSDISAGEYSEDEEENEEDRAFLKDSPMTQRSTDTSYDQSLVYRQSLFTQDPSASNALQFHSGPTRNKPFGRIEPRGVAGRGQRRGDLPSSSPPPPEDYEMDSFVVNDEDDIEYEEDSQTYF